MYFYVRGGNFSGRRHPSYFVNTVEKSRGGKSHYLTLFTGLRPAEQVGVYIFKRGGKKKEFKAKI